MERKKRQIFLDGVCAVYAVENVAAPGRKPMEALRERYGGLCYEERAVGVTRFYKALRQEERIDRVLRVPLREDISVMDVCVPVDGAQYRIRQVQRVMGAAPPCCDLALERLGAGYDFA